MNEIRTELDIFSRRFGVILGEDELYFYENSYRGSCLQESIEEGKKLISYKYEKQFSMGWDIREKIKEERKSFDFTCSFYFDANDGIEMVFQGKEVYCNNVKEAIFFLDDLRLDSKKTVCFGLFTKQECFDFAEDNLDSIIDFAIENHNDYEDSYIYIDRESGDFSLWDSNEEKNVLIELFCIGKGELNSIWGNIEESHLAEHLMDERHDKYLIDREDEDFDFDNWKNENNVGAWELEENYLKWYLKEQSEESLTIMKGHIEKEFDDIEMQEIIDEEKRAYIEKIEREYNE